jgi:hypothetical protein
MQSADHHIMSDIELSSLVEQRFFYILLNDIGLLAAIEVLFFLL